MAAPTWMVPMVPMVPGKAASEASQKKDGRHDKKRLSGNYVYTKMARETLKLRKNPIDQEEGGGGGGEEEEEEEEEEDP